MDAEVVIGLRIWGFLLVAITITGLVIWKWSLVTRKTWRNIGIVSLIFGFIVLIRPIPESCGICLENPIAHKLGGMSGVPIWVSVIWFICWSIARTVKGSYYYLKSKYGGGE